MTIFIECLDNFWLNINKKINKFKSTKLLITLITLIIWKEQKWQTTFQKYKNGRPHFRNTKNGRPHFRTTKMADHILELQKWQTKFQKYEKTSTENQC